MPGAPCEAGPSAPALGLDPSVSLTIDADTSGGRVDSDLPVTKAEGSGSLSSLRGLLGKGGESLRIQTSAGSISIQPL